MRNTETHRNTNTVSYAVSHFIPGLLLGTLLGGLLMYVLVWNGPISVRDDVIERQSNHILELAAKVSQDPE